MDFKKIEKLRNEVRDENWSVVEVMVDEIYHKTKQRSGPVSLKRIVIFSDSQKERIQELLTDQRINCLNAFQTCDEPQAIGAAIMNAKEPDLEE